MSTARSPIRSIVRATTTIRRPHSRNSAVAITSTRRSTKRRFARSINSSSSTRLSARARSRRLKESSATRSISSARSPISVRTSTSAGSGSTSATSCDSFAIVTQPSALRSSKRLMWIMASRSRRSRATGVCSASSDWMDCSMPRKWLSTSSSKAITSAASSRSRSSSARIAPWTALRTRAPISWSSASICSSAASIAIVSQGTTWLYKRAPGFLTTSSPPRNGGVSHPLEVAPYRAPRTLEEEEERHAEKRQTRSHHACSRRRGSRCRAGGHERWCRREAVGRNSERRRIVARRARSREMGVDVQRQHDQLLADRFRWWHLADLRAFRRLRRERRPAHEEPGRRLSRLRPDPVGAHRDHPGLQHPGGCRPPAEAHGHGAREHLPRQHHELERPGHQGAEQLVNGAKIPANNKLSITNPPASKKYKDAWPMSTFTYVIVPASSPKAAQIKAFVNFAPSASAQNAIKPYVLAPMPSSVLNAA